MSVTVAVAGFSPAIARRAAAPRTHSWTVTAITSAANENLRIDGGLCVTPAAASTTIVATAPPIGQLELRRSVLSVVRRQAATGPIPEGRTRISARATRDWWE